MAAACYVVFREFCTKYQERIDALVRLPGGYLMYTVGYPRGADTRCSLRRACGTVATIRCRTGGPDCRGSRPLARAQEETHGFNTGLITYRAAKELVEQGIIDKGGGAVKPHLQSHVTTEADVIKALDEAERDSVQSVLVRLAAHCLSAALRACRAIAGAHAVGGCDACS